MGYYSSPSIRPFMTFLSKFSNGASSKYHNFFLPRKTDLVGNRNLSSSFLCPTQFFFAVQPTSLQLRSIWTSFPLCMGRRACKIADRKNSQNLKKNNRYSKAGKAIISAIKRGGGPNPSTNTLLAAALQNARELNVPKEILERNIRKASEKGQEAFIERTYEIYGFGGVSIVVEASTDKLTRTVASVRDVLKEYGGKLAGPGSVLFKFRRSHVVNVKSTDVDKDKLLAIALDTGAEDVIDPPVYDDDTNEDDRFFKIVCSGEDHLAVLSKLSEEGIKAEPDNGLELLPLSHVEVDDEAMELNNQLISKLFEIDDVDEVYTDQV